MRKLPVRSAVLLACWYAVAAVLCLAQTTLNFPRVISSPDIFTGIAIVNPSGSAAPVTLTAYQSDGTTTSGDGITNPATLSVPAGGQIAKQFAEIFGGKTDFDGWVQAGSPTSGLKGFCLNGNPAETDLDGAAPMNPAQAFVLPFAYEDSVARTDVTIANVSEESAQVKLVLYDLHGREMEEKTLAIPGFGMHRETLSELFGSGDYSTASHIDVTSDRPVIGNEVVLYYRVAGTTERHESLTLSGQLSSSAVKYVLPEFATGDGWLSLAGVVNMGSEQQITLTAYNNDGTLADVANNPKQVSLPANGGFRDTLEDAFGFPDLKLASGWIEVVAAEGHLAAYVAFGNTASTGFAALPAMELKDAAKIQMFPQVTQGAGLFTGLALVNPGTIPANVKFYTLRPDGALVGEADFTLSSNQRNGQLFSELVPASANQIGGWGLIRSDQPLIGDALLGTSNGAALANVPQQAMEHDFVPAAAGKGAPAPNAAPPAVQLLGSRWDGAVTWREKNINYSHNITLRFQADGVCDAGRGRECKWEQNGATVKVRIAETKRECPESGSLVVNAGVMAGTWDHYGGAKCYLIQPPHDIRLKRHSGK